MKGKRLVIKYFTDFIHLQKDFFNYFFSGLILVIYKSNIFIAVDYQFLYKSYRKNSNPQKDSTAHRVTAYDQGKETFNKIYTRID